MGLTDWFSDVADTLTSAAKSAIETAERLAQEAKRELERAIHEAEQVIDNVTGKVRRKADEIERDLNAIVPNFDGKLEEIVHNITETASEAADNGIDITQSINGAVEIVFQEIEKALKAAIDVVNKFLHRAADALFELLEGFLPGFLNRLLEPVRGLIKFILEGLDGLAERLKNGVRWALEKIKSTVQSIVKKIGEVLGPVWEFVKKLWKLLFGAEPEQCSLTAQWFDARMKRTEKEMLSIGEPIVVRKRTYFELLPPAEAALETSVSEFLDTSPIWGVYRTRLMRLLKTPKDGHLVQCSMDEVYTDILGGQQRIQISVLHYRWRTEEFRKVSSGFLGILAMVSAIGKKKEPGCVKVMPRRLREQPLEIDLATAIEIYRLIERNLWLRNLEGEQGRVYRQDDKGRAFRKIMSRDENGWRETRS
ncbi:MAG: hypothetical protein M1820_007671 [Bogoriella megaspora]|nr:MAG: hypothetical protein M1820_007671 [Bogoriella megaspora]